MQQIEGSKEHNPYSPPLELSQGTVSTAGEGLPVERLSGVNGRQIGAVVLYAISVFSGICAIVLGHTLGFPDPNFIFSPTFVLVLVSPLMGIAGFVVFLTWLYPMYRNLSILNPDEMRYSPGWAVAYWFIPVLNLFRPVQCINDMYNGTKSDKLDPDSIYPVLWWLVWLGSSAVSRYSGRQDDWEFSLTMWAVGLETLSNLMTIYLIIHLKKRQQEKAAALGLQFD